MNRRHPKASAQNPFFVIIIVSTLDSALRRLQTWLNIHASDQRIAPLSELPGLPQPIDSGPGGEAVRELWQLTGSSQGYGWIFTPAGPFGLTAPDVALETRSMMRDMEAEELESGDWPEPFYEQTWIPFADNGSGDDLVVDATTGEVLVFDHEERTSRMLATSLDELFLSIADQCERGELVWNEDWGIVPPGYEG